MDQVIDPRDEAEYRRRLAEGHLEMALKALRRGELPSSIQHSQLAAENAAKAIIAIYETPTWSHDPSPQLLEIEMRVDEELRPSLRELAEIVGRLAPEHGRSTYGEPDRGRTPWEIYTHREAESILGDAERAVEIMRRLLGELLG